MPVANSERHSSVGSWRSDKTITPGWDDAKAKILNKKDGENGKHSGDSPVSPGAVPPQPAAPARSAVAPWEETDADEPFPSPLSERPNSSAQGKTKAKNGSTETEIPDPSEAIFHRNGSGVSPFKGDERRPSAASAATASSSGSKSSQAKPTSKKLHGFFGEDLSEARSVSVGSINASQSVESPTRPVPVRSGSSIEMYDSGNTTQQASPSASRPRTPPQPSSDVTPWLYQNPEDINNYGNAPIRDDMTGIDSTRFERRGTALPSTDHRHASNTHHHHHRLPFHRHRHHKSSDDQLPPPSRADTADSYFPPFSDSRQGSIASQMFSASGPKNGKPASTSSNNAETPPKNSNELQHGGKRSILGLFRRTHHGKGTQERDEVIKSQPGSTTSLQQQAKAAREAQQSSSPHSEINVQNASAPEIVRQNTRNSIAPPSASKSHHVSSRIPFRSKKSTTADLPLMKDPNAADAAQNNNEALWTLDTDLQNMEGIITKESTPKLSAPSKTPSWAREDFKDETEEGGPSWDAPDSWAVRKAMDENISRLKEIDETGEPAKDEMTSVPYYIRIFRQDSTFATLNVNLNTTASEIIQMLGKKFMVTEELDTYQIIMRKNSTSRLLQGGERPVSIQRKLLEQAGYQVSDRIEDLGREDHSYLCEFKFLPAKAIGYSSLSKDPGFNKNQKFSNMDLSGRNLITIPIALYQKAGEIVFLNLSQNLSLDVPKDFIRSCINLREIKYTTNDAWRLPASFCLATKLTVLDLSNNSLEQLEHAELWKLENLASLKLANNKLTSVPTYFERFRTLRSLNLSSNLLTELPKSVGEITSLVDLDISFNSISNLPHINKLLSLERLWATNNKLSGGPEESVTNLKMLREVDIRFNSIDNIDTLSKLPQLEQLMAGHNSITAFTGYFTKIRTLHVDHNPITRFDLDTDTPTLTTLNLASAKLAQITEDLFAKLSGLTKLILDKNHIGSLSPQLGRLQKLEHLSVAKNELNAVPSEIGKLCELRFFDARENNISQLPQELWFCRKLETLNLSSNVLEHYPKPPTQAALAGMDSNQANSSPQTPSSQSGPFEATEEDDKITDIASQSRRPSQASAALNASNSPSGSSYRKPSFASTIAGSRKPSLMTRTSTEGTSTAVSRKDSLLITRTNATCIGSLRHLYLADNRLGEDVFDQISNLQELKVVNLSYNEIYEIPSRSIHKWRNLTEFYLSGNELSALPCEDLEEINDLKVLHLNGNKFQVLPAELGKLAKLTVLDVGSNILKYNVANYQYDWNWNCNPTLRYLNLSGNKRLEIKPPTSFHSVRDPRIQTDFSALTSLRVLGLMDVTLMIRQVPEQTENRRVRTAGSLIGTMGYGIADSLGKQEHLSALDLVVPRLEHEDETLIGLFDGASVSTGGSKTAAFLHENFRDYFKTELQRKQPTEDAGEALRRTYLALNKDLALLANESQDERERRASQPAQRTSIVNQTVTQEDLDAGCTAVVIFLQGMDLFVSNVGDAQAVLIQSDGGHKSISQKHDPAYLDERRRIMEAGGFVSRQGKLNDTLSVSRSFGFIPHIPSIIAAPTVSRIQIQETDEMILIASKELWDYLTPDFAVDLARSERNDLMRAAQKLRDLALAFGCQGRIIVMILGVSDLRRKERARYRTHSMSMGPSGLPDEYMASRPTRAPRRGRDATLNSKLARLDQEVEAPEGEVSLVFTDIKNSTIMWETYPVAMQSAIRMHNEVMRRHLRLIGGYEVKTEGDAFMVAFPTVTSALLWCFTIQSQLLEVQWPQEILNSVNGQEVCDSDGNVLFRGLSVRMGIHWGRPNCEPDPVTRRMDYFGPMVNRTARISAVADGGQITVSSDFIAEIQRLLETHIESDRSSSAGSAEQLDDDNNILNIRRELRSLSSHGFEVKDLGERRLKGLENPEYIYLMYPHSLAGRLLVQQQRAEAEKKAASEDAGQKSRDSQLNIDLDQIWDLWSVSLRLEMLCSTLENPGAVQLKAPETALLERTKERGGEVTDRFLINFVEHQVSRIETCITSLAIRNMINPFKDGMLDHSCPMSDVLNELSEKLSELKTYQDQDDFEIAPS